jgi:hypothetical protein
MLPTLSLGLPSEPLTAVLSLLSRGQRLSDLVAGAEGLRTVEPVTEAEALRSEELCDSSEGELSSSLGSICEEFIVVWLSTLAFRCSYRSMI